MSGTTQTTAPAVIIPWSVAETESSWATVAALHPEDSADPEVRWVQHVLTPRGSA